MSMNLHDLVRQSINVVYSDQPLELYRSTSHSNKKGLSLSTYASPVIVYGNFQSEGDSTLDHANLAGQNTITRRLYLYADSNNKTRPWAVYRPLSRSGDYVKDQKGGWWLVTSVLEDFSDAGWVSLRCTLRTTEPDLTIEDVAGLDSEETDQTEEGTGQSNEQETTGESEDDFY